MTEHTRLRDIYSDYYQGDIGKTFTPLIDISAEMSEWGYTTWDYELYRHLPFHDLVNSPQELIDNNMMEVYHSSSEYSNPTKTDYNKKDINSTRAIIYISLNNLIYKNWTEFIETINTTKEVIEREFALKFTPYRISANEVVLISNSLENVNPSMINSRLANYINPIGRGNFNFEQLGSKSDTLHRNVYSFINKKYNEIYDKIKSSNTEEELDEIKDQLEELDNVGSKKSERIVDTLKNDIQPNEDFSNLINSWIENNSAFGFKTATKQYGIEYISSSWLGNRDITTISVESSHYMIPASESIVMGGFSPYQIQEVSDMNIYPKEHFNLHVEDMPIELFSKSDQLSRKLDIENTTSRQVVPGEKAVFLYSVGLARLL